MGLGKSDAVTKIVIIVRKRILRGCGHQMATWTDYVAKVSIINSGFSDLGEENESKFGPLQ